MGYENTGFFDNTGADLNKYGFKYDTPLFGANSWSTTFKMPDDAWKNFGGTSQTPDAKEPQKTPNETGNTDRWAQALKLATDRLNQSNSQNPYSNPGSSDIQSYGGQGITQAGDLTFVPRGSKTVTTTTAGSSNSGLFGKIGGLAGAAGIAAGFLGPLAIPIGAGIGGLIDSARG